MLRAFRVRTEGTGRQTHNGAAVYPGVSGAFHKNIGGFCRSDKGHQMDVAIFHGTCLKIKIRKRGHQRV